MGDGRTRRGESLHVKPEADLAGFSGKQRGGGLKHQSGLKNREGSYHKFVTTEHLGCTPHGWVELRY